MQTTTHSAQQPHIGTILFVDDESNVLSALRRMARPMGVNCIEARSGRDALDVLAKQPVDVVVSDMRMPEMNGATLLKEVATQYPDTVRILLTGFSDVSAAAAAVNEGGIYRYLSKPWQDGELRQTLSHAVQLRALKREKQQLELLTHQQNQELKRLNVGLEEIVQARTQELCLTAEKLEYANRTLNDSYWTTVEMFASLLRAKHPGRGVRHRTVADLARATAKQMNLALSDCDAIYSAGLLCDIGKLALPDQYSAEPESHLRGEALKAYRQYPAIGEAALAMLSPLENAAITIRSHRERLDGHGFPDGKAGEDIPLSARILAVAHDFEAALRGEIYREPFSATQSLELIKRNAGAWYDSKVVDAFEKALREHTQSGSIETETAIGVDRLKPGMTVARNVYNKYGLLLMRAGHTVERDMLEKLKRLRDTNGQEMMIYIRGTVEL